MNVVGADDPRPVELVAFERNVFDFVDEPALTVPMVTPSHQLAEKLHAYTRRYDDETSSRAKDLFDMLVIADQVRLPALPVLLAAARETFRIRVTAWPPELRPPPMEWETPWKAFAAEYSMPWTTLEEAYGALRAFWEPVLSGVAGGRRPAWSPMSWRWEGG